MASQALQNNIGNLWDQLSNLHQKDPDKYKEVIEESAKEYAKLKLPPLPHTCLLVKDVSSNTKNNLTTYLVFTICMCMFCTLLGKQHWILHQYFGLGKVTER